MFTSWMLTAETCRLLVERLMELRPKLAVEFGSGLSTALMAPWCDELLSLDHDPRHAAPWPCVRICRIKDGTYVTDLPDGIDFALIDGPPGRRYGRGGTFPSLWPHLADDFEVWLDDADRDLERGYLEAWQERFPIKVARIGTPKGLAVVRRK